jgi:hypothetical protein
LHLGCEIPPSATPNGSLEDIDPSRLLPYQGPVRGLFDDGIEPEVFGTPADQEGSKDRQLVERVRFSGLVIVVRATTVSDEGYDANGRLEVEFSPVEAPILGDLRTFSRGADSLRVTVSSGTSSYSLIRSNQNDLIGKQLILCLGHFIDTGKPTLHWHAMADSPKVRKAVTAAASMAELVN